MMVTHISSSPVSLFQCESGNTMWVFLEERLLGKASVYTADITPREPMGWKKCCHLLIRTKQGQFTNAHIFNRILSLEGILEKQMMVETEKGTQTRYIVNPQVYCSLQLAFDLNLGIARTTIIIPHAYCQGFFFFLSDFF